jgi:CubicO group peptidase (beta-lactamase class C family)
VKKLKAFLVMAVLLFSSIAPVSAQPGKAVPEDETKITDRFASFLEELRRDLKIPGLSAAIVKDDQVLWAEGFGYADLERKVKATPETVYYLASLTKTFASTILLRLVEQGKLDVDAPIKKFGIRDYSPGVVTIRHLLSHTSEGEPGTFYSYNGYRYSFLGQVIQRVSGRPFRELLIESILKPLQMTGTAPNKTGQSDADRPFAGVYERLTLPYALDEEGHVVRGRYETSFGAAAGMISTVSDLAKYDLALSQDKLLRPATREMAFAPFVSGAGERFPYGLGWFTQEYHGVRLIWHYGYYGPSESTLILKAPGERITLIVLANMDSMSRPFDLGDGDVLTSPVAVAFFRMFIYPRKTGRDMAVVDWKSGPGVVIERLAREKDDLAADLDKREVASRWRMYNAMGPREIADGLLRAYSDLYSKAEPPESHGRPVIAEINGVGDNEYRLVEFTLKRNTSARIRGIGEGRPSEMYDFGGIEDVRTRMLVWLMDYEETVGAGGSASNRLIDKVIELPQGTYRLHFKSDASHSFGRWTLLPPDHSSWGMALFEEKPPSPGEGAVSGQQARIISASDVNASRRLLDSVRTGHPPESKVSSVLRAVLILCGGIFLFAIVLWPVGAAARFLKRRTSKAALAPYKRSRLSVAGTWIGWLNGILGLVYIVAVVLRGALEFLLTNGFDDTQVLAVRLFFMVIPIVSAGLTISLVGFCLSAWGKGYRSNPGRWFFTLLAVASCVFVLVAGYFGLLVYG